MEPQRACPDPTLLAAFLKGRLAEADETVVVTHLDACHPCRERLDQLSNASELLGDRKPRMRPRPDQAEPELERVVAQLKAQDPCDAAERLAAVTVGFDIAKHGAAAVAHTLPLGAAKPCGAAQDQPPSESESLERLGLGFVGPSLDANALGRLDRYDIRELVGRGGMGIVLKAFDSALNRVVAIKVLDPLLSKDPMARRRFTREAQAAAAVCHENVVTIHAVEEADGHPYLVMQYVAGVSLQEKIDRTGSLGLKEILRIGTQTAAGLAAAHAQGLVHRDIKPGNVLLENGVERVKITDFGLARPCAENDTLRTTAGIIVGTPSYMSPEQARGESLDQRTDLFSLGSVLYTMCTARAPFRAATAMALLRKVSDEDPPPIRSLNPEVPDWLAAITCKLMARDREQRYQTADEVARVLSHRLAELQRFEQPGLPVPAVASEVPAKAAIPSCERWWVILASLSAVLATSAAALVLSMVATGHLAPEHDPRTASLPGPKSSKNAVTRGSSDNPGVPDPATGAVNSSSGLTRTDSANKVELFFEQARTDGMNFDGYLTRGRARLQSNELDRAIADLTHAIQLDPKNADPYHDRGWAYALKKEYANAIADYSQVIQIDPASAHAYYHRACALGMLNESKRAVADFDVAIRLVPNYPPYYFERSYAWIQLENWDHVIADSAKVIELTPGNGWAYANRAVAWREKRDFDRAIDDLNRAIQLQPNEASHHKWRGRTHALKGNRDQAIDDYTQALRIAPGDFQTVVDRACVCAQDGRYREAEADFEQALKILPGSDEALLRRAFFLHTARGDYDRAITDCDTALRAAPARAEVFLNRGLAYVGKGKSENAIADFDQVLNLNQPDYPSFSGRLRYRYHELYRGRGRALASRSDWERAIHDYNEALKLAPDQALAHFLRGQARVGLKDDARALADFDEAIRLGFAEAEAYTARGDVRVRRGDSVGAKADHDQAAQLRARSGSRTNP
jgi:tetratricopeptide (TPR) repeat protein